MNALEAPEVPQGGTRAHTCHGASRVTCVCCDTCSGQPVCFPHGCAFCRRTSGDYNLGRSVHVQRNMGCRTWPPPGRPAGDTRSGLFSAGRRGLDVDFAAVGGGRENGLPGAVGRGPSLAWDLVTSQDVSPDRIQEEEDLGAQGPVREHGDGA